MSTTREVKEKVIQYLIKLGFDRELIVSEFSVGWQHIAADLVVFERDLPRIVVEITAPNKLPSSLREEELKFHPNVRTAQSIARFVNSPYYLVSDGKVHYWFITDPTGRPQLLQTPIRSSITPNLNRSAISRDTLLRVFQELREYQYRSILNSNSVNEIALTIWAKLLDEKGDSSLREALSRGEYENYSFHSMVMRDIVDTKYLGTTNFFDQAFEILDRISFRDANLEDVLLVIDEIFLFRSTQRGYVKLPRWVSNFLVRLSNPQQNDLLVDLYAVFGDIFPSAICVEPSLSIRAVHVSQDYLIWACIQQMLSSDVANEPILASRPPYELLQSHNMRNPQRIIVVPPFGDRTNNELWRESRLPRRVRSEGAYLEIAVRLAASFGRIVALIPDTLLFSESQQPVRDLLSSEVNIRAIISLGRFLRHMPLRTSILVLDNDRGAEPSKVFMAELPPVEMEDVFDCLQIPEVKSLFDDFMKSDTENINRERCSTSWEVSRQDISFDNLMPSHYIPPEVSGRRVLSSPFPTVLLKDVASVMRGSSFKLDESGDIPVIGPATIRPMKFDQSALNKTSKSQLLSHPKTARAGDIVINIIGTHCGAAALVPHDVGNSIFNRHVVLVRLESKDVISDYLAIALNSEYVQQQFKREAGSTVIPSLDSELIRNSIIPIPDMEMQQKIVEKVNRLQQKYYQIQQKLEAAERDLADVVSTLNVSGA